MNEFYKADSFADAVDKIKGTSADRKMDLAFKLAEKEMFLEANGMRSSSKKVLVVTVDAEYMKELKKSGQLNDLSILAKRLTKEFAIEILVIGIGDVTIEDIALLTTRSDMKLIDELDEEGGCVGLWNAHMLADWQG